MHTDTIAQYLIVKWINKNFIGVDIELLAPDIVKITDRDGASMRLSININQEIMDYDTREILGR